MIFEKLFGKKETKSDACDHGHIASLRYSEEALADALREQKNAWNDQYESAHSDPKSGKFLKAVERKETADKKVAELQALKAEQSHLSKKVA